MLPLAKAQFALDQNCRGDETHPASFILRLGCLCYVFCVSIACGKELASAGDRLTATVIKAGVTWSENSIG